MVSFWSFHRFFSDLIDCISRLYVETVMKAVNDLEGQALQSRKVSGSANVEKNPKHPELVCLIWMHKLQINMEQHQISQK